MLHFLKVNVVCITVAIMSSVAVSFVADLLAAELFSRCWWCCCPGPEADVLLLLLLSSCYHAVSVVQLQLLTRT
jgi:hypothetical protein